MMHRFSQPAVWSTGAASHCRDTKNPAVIYRAAVLRRRVLVPTVIASDKKKNVTVLYLCPFQIFILNLTPSETMVCGSIT